MKYILRISPPFLRRFDAYLRMNYPWLWATRFHLNLYIGVMALAVVAIIGLLIPVKLNSVPGEYYFASMSMLFAIPAVAWLIFMFRQMSLYNQDKFHGKQGPYREFVIFLIYLATFAMPVLIPLTASKIVETRVQSAISEEDFYKDCYTFATAERYFPRGIYSFDYYPNDTIYLNLLNVDRPSSDEIYYDSRYRRNLTDSVFFQEGAYSVSRPHLYFVEFTDSYSLLGYSDSAFDSRVRQYHYRYNVDRDMELASNHIEEFVKLLKKYSAINNVHPSDILNDYQHNNYKFAASSTYLSDAISMMQENLRNIGISKNEGHFFHEYIFWVVMSVLIFYISLFFSIFKQVRIKPFFMTMAIVAIINFVLGVFEMIMPFQNAYLHGLMAIFLFLVVYFIVKFRAKKFSLIANQVTILLNVVAPVAGLFILLYISVVFDFFTSSVFSAYQLRDQFGHIEFQYSEEYYSLVESIWKYTYWIGLGLYVVLWNTLFKKAYLRLWNLPRLR